MIKFKNHQWEVTSNMVKSCRPYPTYEFEAKRLSETTDRGYGIFYEWPVHLAEKNWVDVDAFNEAFVRALEIHKGKYVPPLDAVMLKHSLEESLKIRSGS